MPFRDRDHSPRTCPSQLEHDSRARNVALQFAEVTTEACGLGKVSSSLTRLSVSSGNTYPCTTSHTRAHEHVRTRTNTYAHTLGTVSRDFAVRECNKLSLPLSLSLSLSTLEYNARAARFYREQTTHTTYIPTHESAATARSPRLYTHRQPNATTNVTAL